MTVEKIFLVNMLEVLYKEIIKTVKINNDLGASWSNDMIRGVQCIKLRNKQVTFDLINNHRNAR